MIRRLLLILLLASACFGQVAPGTSYQNSGSVVATTGTVVMTSTAANSCVLLFEVIDDDGTTTFNTPTAAGLTFAQVGSTIHTAADFYVLVWRAYTTASLGSTTVTATWNTTSADWVLEATGFTGTAATSANNCSDGIGGTNTATGTGTAETVTVTSTSHNNSKYYGAVAAAAGSSALIVKGVNYTALSLNTFNASFETALTELSTSPVTPAASTAVNATSNSDPWAIVGIELLAASSGPNIGFKGKVGFIGKVGIL